MMICRTSTSCIKPEVAHSLPKIAEIPSIDAS